MSRRLSALVLAAGLGTRLRPLTWLRAKPAAPVCGQPIIVRVLQWLAAHDIRDVVVNLHHLPASITALIGDGRALGLRVRYSWEDPVLGSAGGPRRALPLLETDPFLIVNGDTLTDADPWALADFHHDRGAAVSMALVPMADPARYGGVTVDGAGRVTGFTRRGSTVSALHFIGLQVARKSVFAPLADGVAADSVGGLYRTLITDQPGALLGWASDASFHDVGTLGDYLSTSLAFAAREGLADPPVGARCRVARTARLSRVVLWDDVVVGERCDIQDAVVGDGATLPDGFHLKAAVAVPADRCPPNPGGRLEGNLRIFDIDDLPARDARQTT